MQGIGGFLYYAKCEPNSYSGHFIREIKEEGIKHKFEFYIFYPVIIP
jgi:hypothetical protein